MEAEKKTSDGADEAFKNAVKILTAHNPNKAVEVAERMKKAEKATNTVAIPSRIKLDSLTSHQALAVGGLA